MTLLIFVLITVILFFSFKTKRIIGGLIQLVFAILMYVITRDFLSTSIHDVISAKIFEFLFKYFLFLTAILVYGLLGLGNIFIGIMSGVGREKFHTTIGQESKGLTP